MAENVLHDAKGGKPTPHAYEELQRAFDFFNERLFDGRIPQCLLTLQRKARACGYYSPRRFINASGELIDEIALNPETFALDTVADILSTQVHEMCHAWRQHFGGKKSRRSYHDRVRAIRRNSSSPKIVPVGKRVIIGVAQISRAREIQIDSRATNLHIGNTCVTFWA